MSKSVKHVYGVLLYRETGKGREVFLCKENGPQYWVKSHSKTWGVPKGRAEGKEAAFEVAKREFKEEIGAELPVGDYSHLISVASVLERKILTVYVMKVSVDVRFTASEPVTKEWPLMTGNLITYPEIFTAKWVSEKKAKKIVLPRQQIILTALKEHCENR